MINLIRIDENVQHILTYTHQFTFPKNRKIPSAYTAQYADNQMYSQMKILMLMMMKTFPEKNAEQYINNQYSSSAQACTCIHQFIKSLFFNFTKFFNYIRNSTRINSQMSTTQYIPHQICQNKTHSFHFSYFDSLLQYVTSL